MRLPCPAPTRIHEATGARPSGRFKPEKEKCRYLQTALPGSGEEMSRAEMVKRRKRRAPERGLQAASCAIAAKAVSFPGSRAMPTLKRHKCRAPVAFHAFMNTRPARTWPAH
jgi:hypothetical protein